MPTKITHHNWLHDCNFDQVTVTSDQVLRFLIENHVPWEIHNSIEISRVTVTPPKTQLYLQLIIKWKSTFSNKNLHDQLFHDAYVPSWSSLEFFPATKYQRRYRCHLVMAVPRNTTDHSTMEILTPESSKFEYESESPPPTLDSDLYGSSD